MHSVNKTLQETTAEHRKREQGRKNDAFNAAENLVGSVGRTRRILPSEFLEHVKTEAKVGDYIARMVLDNLRSLHQLEYVVGKGIRSTNPDVNF